MELVLLFFFKVVFIYSREMQREREAETRQREKQAPCGEPDVGLDPGTLGSCPELKAATELPGHPRTCAFKPLFSSGSPTLQCT